MRIVGVTQGSNLEVFLGLVRLLRQQMGAVDCAAYVCDSMVYRKLSAGDPMLQDPAVPVLREWELYRQGVHRRPDWGAISAYEEEIGDPVLWNALLADRRIFFGRRCKMRQDYPPRFSHAQMGGILQVALESISSFLEQVRPDVVMGFGTSTLGDYLFYRFAKARGLPYLLLKATKIGNYVSLNDDAVALSSHIARAYAGQTPIEPSALAVARSHLASTRERGIRYEGAIRRRSGLAIGEALARILRGAGADLRHFRDPVVRNDNHAESMFLTHLYGGVLNPIAGKLLSVRLGSRLVTREKLRDHQPFAFYPLHFEPEVSMQVFGRPFQNQIEVVRALALALPAGMRLLVKEHPRSVGYRRLSYYEKLLAIPNVGLIDPHVSTHAVIQHAALVAVISGSTGLEAAICGRPVLLFGIPVYNVLPAHLVRSVHSLHELGTTVRTLLREYKGDEAALERFIAATVMGSVPVDLYTVLLRKPGRISEGRADVSEEHRRREDYERLGEYCRRRIADVCRVAAVPDGDAKREAKDRATSSHR